MNIGMKICYGAACFLFLLGGRPAMAAGIGTFYPGATLGGNEITYDVALFDFDGDGARDVFAVNNGTNRLYLNKGGGVFTVAEQVFGTKDSRGAAVGDLNSDGLPDLVVANYDAANEVWINNGSARFSLLAQPAFTNAFYSQSVKLADLDGDGDLDLFVAKSAVPFGLKARVYLNNGQGVFVELEQPNLALQHSGDVLLQDMNGDGFVDALLGNNGANSFLRNNGKGVFTPYAADSYVDDTMHLAGGDLNGDGAPDFIAANAWPGPCRVYINKADGSGTTLAAQEFGAIDATGAALADVNGDGFLDVILADWGDNGRVMTNSGNGLTYGNTGQTLSTNNNQQVAAADLNGDGTPDLVFANYGAPNEIWYNAQDRVNIASTNKQPVKNNEPASTLNGTDFGTVAYGRSVTNRFVLKNLGLTEMIISEVATNGAHATEFAQFGLPERLQPFASAPFDVVFSPSTIASCSANLSLAVAGEATAFVMQLAGTGEKAGQKITFPNPGTQIWTNRTVLEATSDSGLPVSYRLLSGPAVMESSNTLSYTDTGNVTIAADQAGDAHYLRAASVTNEFLVAQATATITLSGLNQVYSGLPCAVTAETSATEGRPVIYYTGDDYVRQTNAPVNAGSYEVLAIQNTTEWYGQTNGVLVIVPAPQAITAFTPDAAAQCTTNVLALSASAASGLTVTNFECVAGPGVVARNILTFTNGGTVLVRTMQPGNRNWEPTPWRTNRYQVDKAVAQVQLGNTQQVYNGTARPVSVAVTPTSLIQRVVVTYNGVTNVPVDAGLYLARAAVIDPIWQGGATTILRVARADPALVWNPASEQITTNSVALDATSSSPGAIHYSVVSGPGVVSGAILTFTNDGQVVVLVDQLPTHNYTALATTRTLHVTKAPGVITPAAPVYYKMFDGLPPVIPYTTAPVADMAVDWVCNGSTNLPVHAGTYGATGTLVNAMYQGATSTVFVITQAVQAITFEVPSEAQPATSTVPLSAEATSELEVSFRIESGPGRLTDGTNLSFTTEGSVVLRAMQGGSQDWRPAPDVLRTVLVTKAVGTLIITDTNQVYSGSERPVAVATVPDGLTNVVTYDARTQAPVNAGEYAVRAVINDALFCGTNHATLIIEQAPQEILFTDAGPVNAVDGKSLTAEATSGLAVSYAIEMLVPSNEHNLAWITNGNQLGFSVTSPVSEAVVSASQPGNSNWLAAGSVTNVFLVYKQFSRVEPGSLSAIYDGQPHAATWSCTNAAVTNVVIYYDGSERSQTNPPVNAGTYPVWALISQPDYMGGGSGEMVIEKSTQAVNFVGLPASVFTTNIVTLLAAATSGLEPVYSLGFGPAVLEGSTLSFTNPGLVQVIADQAGNSNWLPASVAQVIEVSKTPAQVAFVANTLTQVYTAAEITVQIETIPEDLDLVITYGGSVNPPVEVGTYAVTGRVDDIMYCGGITGLLTITKAPAVVTLHGTTGQVYNGQQHHVTATTAPAISGEVVITYNGSLLAPTQAGTYEVMGIIVDSSYSGTSVVEMVIDKAPQEISDAIPSDGLIQQVGDDVTCSASATSGFAVQFTNLNADAPITWTAPGQFHIYSTGLVQVAFTQTGDVNWAAAPMLINTVFVEAVAGTYYVALTGNDRNDGLSWAAPKQTIQAALDITAAGSVVWVSNGVYETGGRVVEGQALTNRVVVPAGIYLMSANGALATTIRGQAGTGVDAPLGPDAIRCAYMHQGAFLHGFTLDQGGTLAGEQPVTDAMGGGIYASGGAIINLCILQRNQASFGGAIAGTNLHLVVDSLLTGNAARHTAGAAWRSFLVGSTVSDNTASDGGGIGGESSNQYAAAISSILYGNNPDDANEFTVALASCLGSTNGLLDVLNCITNAPSFVDASATNYTLQADSPCIEQGVVFFLLNQKDLAGNPRIVFEYPDMGAYEYAGVPAQAVEMAVSDLQPWQFAVSWENGGWVPVTNYFLTISNDLGVVEQRNMGEATVLTVTNLTPNVTYYATVMPQNEYGDALPTGISAHTPKADQAILFSQQGAVNAFEGITLEATSGSGLPVAYAVSYFAPSNAQNYCWISNGTHVGFSVTNIESVMLVVASQDGNDQWNPAPSLTNTFYVYPAFARVSLTNLNFTYDQLPHAPDWSCTNAAVTNVVLYYGDVKEASTNAPVNAGTYPVYALIKQPDIKGGGMATMVIARASQEIQDFNLPATALTTQEVALAAVSSVGLTPVTFNVVYGPGELAGNLLTFTAHGTVSVMAGQAGNSNYLAASVTQVVAVSKTPVQEIAFVPATLNQTYSGSPRMVSATTVPAWLSLIYEYDGQPDAPIDTGIYSVRATVDDDMYYGSVTGVLTIVKADPALVFQNPGAQWTTNRVTLSVTSDSPETITLSVVSGPAVLNGYSLTFTNAGEVTLSAIQATGSNWNAASSNVAFAVSKAVAPVLVSGTDQVYDGTARAVTVETVPSGLQVNVTYDGSPVPPVNAGDAQVIAAIAPTEPMYTGASTTVLHVAKADQSIVFMQQGAVNAYDGVILDATAGSGLPVSYVITDFTPSNEFNYCWMTNGNQIGFSVTNYESIMIVEASQDGNANWNPAAPVTNTFYVYPTLSRVTLSNLDFTYDHFPHAPDWSSTNAAVTNVVLYYGDVQEASTNAPVNAGTYPVYALIKQPDIKGGGMATMVIARASQEIQDYNLPATALTTQEVALAAVSSVGLTPVTFNVVYGPGELAGNLLTFTANGTVTVMAGQAGNSNYLAVAVTQDVAVSKTPVQGIAFVPGSLARVYSGMPLPVVATTDPSGLTLNYEYNGATNVPVNAGTYAVGALVFDPIYFGSVTGTQTIAKADPALVFANPGAQWTTNRVTLSVTSDSPETITLSVVSGPAVLNGYSLTFTNEGEVILSAIQATGSNWNAASSNVAFSVSKAIAPVTVSGTDQVYDGTARAVTVETDPSGLAVDITYDGSPTPPVNAGDAQVIAAIAPTEPMYTGASTTVLHVAKADQSIVFMQQGAVNAYDGVILDATAGSGLPVSYVITDFTPSNEFNYCWMTNGNQIGFSVTNYESIMIVEASQDGNANWNPAAPVTNTFYVYPTLSRVTLSNLDFTYDQLPHAPDWSSTNAAVTNVVLYYGNLDDISTSTPVNAGTYPVYALIKQPDIKGGGMATMIIARASQEIQNFNLPATALTTQEVALAAISSEGQVPVVFSVLDGPGVLDENLLTFTAHGTVSVMAGQAGNSNYLAVAVTQEVAVSKTPVQGIAFVPGSLAQVYSGMPLPVVATTDPSGLTLNYEYNGATNVPVNAGTYAVGALVFDPIYFGSVTGTQTIAKADPALIFQNPGAQWTTNRVTLSVTSDSPETITLSVVSGPAVLNGYSLTFTNAGEVTLSAIQATGSNWNAASSNVAFAVSKAVAPVLVSGTDQVYDGTARDVTVETVPPGLQVNVTYDGSPVPPVNAGDAQVIAAIAPTEPMYTGASTTVLHVAKADQSIVFMQQGAVNAYDGVILDATAGSGLPVSYVITDFTPSNEFNYCWMTNGNQIGFSVTNYESIMIVEASQDGNANWNPATPVTNTFYVYPTLSRVMLSNLDFTYDHFPHAPDWSSTNAAVTNVVLYYGNLDALSTNAPVNAGTYPVYALIKQPDIKGGGMATMVIARASQEIQDYNLPATALTTQEVALAAVSSVGLTPITFNVVNGPGELAENLLTFTAHGTVSVMAGQAGNSNYLAVAVTQDVAVSKTPVQGIAFVPGSLAQVYSGMPLPVVATTDPSGLTLNYEYDGATNVPVNAGTYAVGALVFDPIYFGSVTGTQTIAKADPALVFANPGAQWTTNRVTLSVTSDSPETITLSVVSGPAVLNGYSLTFTNAGDVILSAIQATGSNWNGASSNVTFSVSKAIAPVTVSETEQVYDGTARAVTVETVPPGLAVDITYDGSPTPPVNAGDAQVIAAIAPTEPMYTGSSTTVLHVAKADQSIVFMQQGAVNAYEGVTLDATAGSGLPVSYVITDFTPSNEFNYCWMTNGNQIGFSVTNYESIMIVEASQDGNANWNPAAPVTNTFYVYPTLSRVTLSNLDFTYDQLPHAPDWSSTNAAVTNVVLYYGNLDDISTSTPVNAGTYPVYALIKQPDIKGGCMATMIIARASQEIQDFNLSATALTTQEVALAAISSEGQVPVIFSVLSGPGALAGNLLTFTGPGAVSVMAGQAGNSNYLAASVTQEVAVSKTPVQGIAFVPGSLAQVYSGMPLPVVATTDPSGLTLNYEYDGATNVPVNAGTYAVGALVLDPIYFGSVTGTQTIAKADPALVFQNPGAQWTTNRVTLSVTSDSPETITLSVVSGPAVLNGYSLTFTNAGEVSLSAIQATGSNWNAASSNVAFAVSKAVAPVLVSGTDQVYDGTERRVTVETVPPGLQVNVTYDGSPVPPVNAGDAQVVAMIDPAEPLYTGSSTAVLHVAKADQAIHFTQMGAVDAVVGLDLDATADSGLPVTCVITDFSPSNENNYCWMTNYHIGFNVTNNVSTMAVVASQVGNTNWNAAQPVERTYWIYPEFVPVQLDGLQAVYDGLPHAISWSCTNAAVTNVVIYYDGADAQHTNPPVNAGAHPVAARIDQPNIWGGAMGELVIAKATQSIVRFTLPIHALTTNRVVLSAESSIGLTGIAFRVISGPGVISGTLLSFTNSGTVSVEASHPGNSNYLAAAQVKTVQVDKTPLTQFVLDTNTLVQTYTGEALHCAAIAVPSVQSISYLYDGITNWPVAAADYSVVATAVDPIYSGTDVGIFSIIKATPEIVLYNPGDQVTTNRDITLVVATDCPLPVDLLVIAGPAILVDEELIFTNAGSVTLEASQAGDGNWNPGASQVTFDVTKAWASVSILNTQQTYNGSARPVGTATVPEGLAVVVTYDGSLSAPTNGGDYGVIARVAESEPIYQGQAAATLHVGRAAQWLDFPNPGPVLSVTSVVSLAATASSGLPVSDFLVVSCVPSNTPDCCRISASNTLHFSMTNLAMVVHVAANQAGDINWLPAPTATNEILVYETVYLLTIRNTNQVYAGTPRTVEVVNEHPEITNIVVTYDGSTNPPVHVGIYDVIAQSRQTDVAAFGAGQLYITPASLVITANFVSVKYSTNWPPAFSAKIEGFVNGETTNVFTSPLQFDTDADQHSRPGRYTIEPYGAEADDYEITFQDGTLQIRGAEIPWLMPLLLDRR